MKSTLLTLSRIALLAGAVAGCTGATPTTLPAAPTAGSDATPTAGVPTAELSPTPEPLPLYRDSTQPIERRVEDLLSRMTLDEKIGQMTQVEHNSILATSADVTRLSIGSILSGGSSLSPTNTAEEWRDLVDGFQKLALQNRLGIPLIYGIDAVHGHAHVNGATVFPHNIGLGATRDPALVERIGRITAEEVAATSIRWNFAPVVAVVQDIRWGRTYEAYSENTEVVTQLGTAYVQGMQNLDGQPALSDPKTVLATPKHFIGDGGTAYGTSTTEIVQPYLLDQGNTLVDEATLRARYLPPYQAAVEAGAQSIMVSFSSWNGTKMHAHKYLLTDVLKGELGFKGFLISDWQAIDQIPGDYASDVATAINAGLDMIMVPYDYRTFISTLKAAVEQGQVPPERIDDAVRRILTVKFALGLFERSAERADPEMISAVGSEAHREVAREAVRKSLVLLKNENQTLPLAKDTPLIFVAGEAADDLGVQSGGWTIDWQGLKGDITTGTTLLEGIRQTVSTEARVEYNARGRFQKFTDAQGNPEIADVGLVVLGEAPYAEGVGDRADLTLSAIDRGLINQVRERSRTLVVILVSGRPLIVTDQLSQIDALVAAWLPGSEGQGVADVLFGDYEFSGKLPYTWPRWNSQLPFNFERLPDAGCEAPLFAFGYGLTTTDPSPALLDCQAP